MTATGGILDYLAALAVAAVPTLTTANTERRITLSKDLETEQLPHCFIHNPDQRSEEAIYLQEIVTLTVSMTVVTRAPTTQEETLEAGEQIRAAIRADPKLGGLVARARVSDLNIREHPAERDRAADLIVVAELEA